MNVRFQKRQTKNKETTSWDEKEGSKDKEDERRVVFSLILKSHCIFERPNHHTTSTGRVHTLEWNCRPLLGVPWQMWTLSRVRGLVPAK